MPEHAVNPRANKRAIVDGTLIDNFHLVHGYWEAKDIHDDLPAEVERKFAAGYPRDDFLLQSTSSSTEQCEYEHPHLDEPRSTAGGQHHYTQGDNPMSANNVSIPYARHSQTRDIVDPSQVERGLAANVECLVCGEKLQARKGKKNVCHFAHKGDFDCAGESVLHLVSKQKLATGIGRLLPAPDISKLGHLRINSGATETGIDGESIGWRADVTLGVEIERFREEHHLIAEVNVTNRKTDDYIALLKKRNVPALEVNVPVSMARNLEDLDQIWFGNEHNWRWLNRTRPFGQYRPRHLPSR